MYTYRLCELKDAQSVSEIIGPYILHTPVTFEMTLPSVVDFEERIRTNGAFFPWIVVEHDAEVVGFAYAVKHRVRQAYQWSVELSVYVKEAYRSKGLAKDLYDRLTALLKEQGIYNAYAGITLPNEASIKFHKKMGFEDVGVYKEIGWKLDKWHDVLWMGKTLQEKLNEPSHPISINELDDDLIKQLLA